jgi:hypothetical protein
MPPIGGRVARRLAPSPRGDEAPLFLSSPHRCRVTSINLDQEGGRGRRQFLFCEEGWAAGGLDGEWEATGLEKRGGWTDDGGLHTSVLFPVVCAS